MCQLLNNVPITQNHFLCVGLCGEFAPDSVNVKKTITHEKDGEESNEMMATNYWI